MSILAILDQRIEFTNTPTCPACGVGGHHNDMRFTTARTVRDGRGHLTIEVTGIGELDPHLIVTCARCGADWEMECFT